MFCGRESLAGGGPGTAGPCPPPTPPSQPAYQGLTKLKGLGEEAWGTGQGSVTHGSLPYISDSLALGLDFGSRFVKLVYGSGESSLVRRKLDSLVFYRDYLVRDKSRLEINWRKLGLPEPQALIVTGYGKNLLKEHFPTITEVRASFMGARRQTGLTHFILLEMGGQDTKVMYVKDGRVFDFLTNDRCAAGTGRYLENMARFLKIPLREFVGFWQDPTHISQTCAIFGESELIGFLLDGAPAERIAAGINASVARRALALVRRYPCRTLVFTGGVAQNRAVVRMLQEESGLKVVVPSYPQFIGAFGCYLEARTQPAKTQP